jgi:hypothetical protein
MLFSVSQVVASRHAKSGEPLLAGYGRVAHTGADLLLRSLLSRMRHMFIVVR